MEPFEQLSGKVCSHSKFLINLGKKGVLKDKMWTGKQCNGRDLTDKPYSANENRAHTRFSAVRLAVKTIKTSSTSLASAYEAYAAVRENYKSFNSYLWKTETAKWNTQHPVSGGVEE